jgi:hypothetical protein
LGSEPSEFFVFWLLVNPSLRIAFLILFTLK